LFSRENRDNSHIPLSIAPKAASEENLEVSAYKKNIVRLISNNMVRVIESFTAVVQVVWIWNPVRRYSDHCLNFKMTEVDSAGPVSKRMMFRTATMRKAVPRIGRLGIKVFVAVSLLVAPIMKFSVIEPWWIQKLQWKWDGINRPLGIVRESNPERFTGNRWNVPFYSLSESLDARLG